MHISASTDMPQARAIRAPRHQSQPGSFSVNQPILDIDISQIKVTIQLLPPRSMTFFAPQPFQTNQTSRRKVRGGRGVRITNNLCPLLRRAGEIDSVRKIEAGEQGGGVGHGGEHDLLGELQIGEPDFFLSIFQPHTGITLSVSTRHAEDSMIAPAEERFVMTSRYASCSDSSSPTGP